MTERLKQIETIARACGWETEIRDGQFIEVTDSDVPPFDFSFDPFLSEDHWFRAFDAMGGVYADIDKTNDAWICRVVVSSDIIIGVEAHPDRLTAMGLALHAAAKAKLGEVER